LHHCVVGVIAAANMGVDFDSGVSEQQGVVEDDRFFGIIKTTNDVE